MKLSDCNVCYLNMLKVVNGLSNIVGYALQPYEHYETIVDINELKYSDKNFSRRISSESYNKLYNKIKTNPNLTTIGVVDVSNLILDPKNKELTEFEYEIIGRYNDNKKYIIYDYIEALEILHKLNVQKVNVEIVKIKKIEISIRDKIIIMGNGSSMRDVDLNMLTNYDTFGLKGAYKIYQQRNWWPKFWGTFDTDWIASEERTHDIKHLINNSPIEKFFFLADAAMADIGISEKMVLLHGMSQRIIFLPEMEMHSWEKITKEVTDYLMKKQNIDYMSAKSQFLRLYCERGCSANMIASGIIKSIEGKEVTSFDYQPKGSTSQLISKKSPENLYQFYWKPTSSPTTACYIAKALGYKKIILLGVDVSYNSESNNYWDDIILSKEDSMSNKEEQMKKMKPYFKHTDNWKEYITELNDKINIGFIEFKNNNLDIDIVNCSPKSNLLEIRKSTLENEL